MRYRKTERQYKNEKSIAELYNEINFEEEKWLEEQTHIRSLVEEKYSNMPNSIFGVKNIIKSSIIDREYQKQLKKAKRLHNKQIDKLERKIKKLKISYSKWAPFIVIFIVIMCIGSTSPSKSETSVTVGHHSEAETDETSTTQDLNSNSDEAAQDNCIDIESLNSTETANFEQFDYITKDNKENTETFPNNNNGNEANTETLINCFNANEEDVQENNEEIIQTTDIVDNIITENHGENNESIDEDSYSKDLKGEEQTNVAENNVVSIQLAPTEKVYTFVLNTNTKKYHYQGCRYIKQMSDCNKEYFTGTSSEVRAMGYTLCGHCANGN